MAAEAICLDAMYLRIFCLAYGSLTSNTSSAGSTTYYWMVNSELNSCSLLLRVLHKFCPVYVKIKLSKQTVRVCYQIR